MQGKRAERVAELIRQELSATLITRLRDPRLGFVTVTNVEVSNDLQHAKVFYSVMGDAVQKKKSAEALDHARGFLQRGIAKVINLRYTPELRFFLDESLACGEEIDKVLQQIREDRPPDDSEPS